MKLIDGVWYYFNTDDEKKLREIEQKASIIGYARVLRRTYRKAKESEAYKARLVDYCKNILTELVPQVECLSF